MFEQPVRRCVVRVERRYQQLLVMKAPRIDDADCLIINDLAI